MRDIIIRYSDCNIYIADILKHFAHCAPIFARKRALFTDCCVRDAFPHCASVNIIMLNNPSVQPCNL